MLGGGAWERSIKKGEKETFKDLDSWGQKGDGTVRGTKRGGFVRLQNGNDGGSLPDYREVSIGDGEVKERVRYLVADCPRCLRCKAVSPSGPMAVEFELLWMASSTSFSVKGLNSGSILWIL